MSITLESVKVDHVTSPGRLNRVVVGRLVMPAERAEEMARGLLDFLAQQKSGKTTAPQGSATI